MNDLLPTRSRIVLVEDDIMLARTTRRALSELHDVDIDVCHDVASAREALSRPFSVLVSDFNLPDGTGLDVLAAAAEAAPRAPRILVTASTQWDTAARCINEGGAYRVLAKPLSSDVLVATVAGAIILKRDHDSRVEADALAQMHQIELASASADLFVERLNVERLHEELAAAGRQTLALALAQAIDRRFGDDGPSTEQVALVSRRLAERLGVDAQRVRTIEVAALLRRIGSIALRDDASPDVVGEIGAQILRTTGIASEVQDVLDDQGEHFDGTGVNGRGGISIALGSRVLAVAVRYLEFTRGSTRPEVHRGACEALVRDEVLDAEIVAVFVTQPGDTWHVENRHTLPYAPSFARA